MGEEFCWCDFPCLLGLVTRISSVPVSNSFIETVFSLANIQWTDSRNLLLPATVNSLLQVKVNFDHKGSETYSHLLCNNTLLKINGNEKYDSLLYGFNLFLMFIREIVFIVKFCTFY